MADVPMPESMPCDFNEAWVGSCKKPSTNGRCTKHENLVCCSCGERATRSCSEDMGLVCGQPLCATCQHSLGNDTHVTGVVHQQQVDKREEERKALEASRTSHEQRMDETLTVPANLFELLKGDLVSWTLKKFYYLQIKHGLMGFHPCVRSDTKEIVLTLEVELLFKVWCGLEPRVSEIKENTGYVNEELDILYPIIGGEASDHERSRPQHILTQNEYREVLAQGEEEPFKWFSGLIGCYESPEGFRRIIENAARNYKVTLDVA